MSKTPRGVTVIMTDSDGGVIASASDFHADRNGGPTLARAQEARAKASLKAEVVHSMVSPRLARAMDGYALQVLYDLLTGEKGGCRVTVITHGHDAE